MLFSENVLMEVLNELIIIHCAGSKFKQLNLHYTEFAEIIDHFHLVTC